jgi:MFS family permease
MDSQKVSQSPPTNTRFFYGYIVVAASFLIMMVSYGIFYSFGIFFKPLIYEFGWTRAVTSGAFSLSWIMHGSAGLFIGALYDRFGPRIAITLCGLLAGTGYLLISQVTAIWHLYLIYGVLIGVGSHTFVPLMAVVAKLFVQRRTAMTGISTVGIGLGSLIVPPLANKIILAYDWRVSFIVLGALVLVVVISAAQLLRQDATRVEQLANNKSKTIEDSSKLETESFSFTEAIATRQFWIIFGMIFCFGFCILVIQVHIVPYATDLGISANSAALILATVGGSSILGRIVLGGVGDRIGNRRAYIIVFVMMALALLWLMPSRDAWSFYLLAFIFGLAYGNGVAQESPLVAKVFGLTSLGSILGVIVLSFGIGAAVGPVLAGYIFDVTGSYHIALIMTAAISVIALVLTILLRPIKSKTGRNPQCEKSHII